MRVAALYDLPLAKSLPYLWMQAALAAVGDSMFQGLSGTTHIATLAHVTASLLCRLRAWAPLPLPSC
jgi:hypothetical protein